MWGLIFFVAGLIIGSFLNVVIYRLPREESIMGPRSQCPQCRKTIAWFDNIPLVSFVVLGARCRSCKAPISIRYPLVELLGGVSAWGAYTVWGISPPTFAVAFLFFACVAVSFIDFEHQIIPDEINALGLVVGILFSVAYPVWHGATTRMEGFLSSMAGLVAGGGILFLMGWIGDHVFKKESMGGGDVKFMAFLGTFLGWQGVFLALFFASFIGAICGLGLKMARGMERIPFGPYLAVGAAVHILAGDKIVLWYFERVLQL